MQQRKRGGKKKKHKKEEEQKPDDTFLSLVVLGISMIAMGEEIGSEMPMRQFSHLVSLRNLLHNLLASDDRWHYDYPIICKSVPLALALISTSNPQLPMLDMLSKGTITTSELRSMPSLQWVFVFLKCSGSSLGAITRSPIAC